MARYSSGVVALALACAVLSASLSACDAAQPVANKPLGFTAADGTAITDPTECSKQVTETSQCKTCCGALEPNLTEAQAAEVVRDLKTHADIAKFSFPLPEPYLGCLASCSFADIARQIAK